MNETLRYCINHPWQFLVFAIGCGILLEVLLRYIREIQRLTFALARLLFEEFKPSKNRTVPALINVIIIGALFIIALVEGLPSALKHVFGGEINENATYIFSYATLYLFIVSIGSPTWLYIIEREKRIKKLINDALDK